MKRSISLLVLATALFGAACGDDDTSTAPIPDLPTSIVSLSPTHTEILFAIGAGDLVIAVDDMSNFPAEALDKPHDLSGFEPNVEAIASLEPDLVVIADDSKDLSGQLGALDIEVWVGPAPATFDDVYAQIEQLGAATGHGAEAAALVTSMKADIDAAVEGTTAEGLTYFHELDPSLYTVTSTTFIGQVYGLFGMASIADGVEEGNDYPQINAEYLITSDPDLIFLADATWSGESAATVAARPGWDAVTAVRNGAVIVIDDDIASRWGPRLVDFVTAVAAALEQVSAS